MEIVSQPFLPVLIWLFSRSPNMHGSFNFFQRECFVYSYRVSVSVG